jgi:HSP20 family protein
MTTTASNPTTAQAPACGVTETIRKPIYSVSGNAEAYEVRIEMPGVPKSGVKIDLDQNVLTVRGERTPAAPSNWKTLHRELAGSNYQIRLRLNSLVDAEAMKASMENGVLILQLPVKAKAKPRQIQIQ